jgi:NADH-ubiquinone oxidoreductase chain 1
LAEAESELVSGFMTEHAAVIFVFFFLAEYASIVLICTLTAILFFGGYLYNYIPFSIITLIEYFNIGMGQLSNEQIVFPYPMLEGLIYGLSLGLKSSILIFVFI